MTTSYAVVTVAVVVGVVTVVRHHRFFSWIVSLVGFAFGSSPDSWIVVAGTVVAQLGGLIQSGQNRLARLAKRA